MTSKFSAFFSASVLIIAVAASAPALARDNNLPMGGKTKTELKADGYTCVRVSTGFEECTKKDSPTYWCSGESCEQAPTRTNPRNQLPNINLNNQILTR